MVGVKLDVRDIQCGAVVASGESVLGGPWNLIERPTKTFTIKNLHPTLTLSGLRIEVNPDHYGSDIDQRGMMGGQPPAANTTADPNPGLWDTYATISNLGPGELQSVVANDLFKYWRLVANNRESTDIMVSGWGYAASM